MFKQAGRLPIHFASERRSASAVTILKTLIHMNPGFRTAADKNGNLPLHFAIRSGNMSAVQFLLQKDPKKQICAKDVDGNTPLHLAVHKGIFHVSKSLRNQPLIF
uniref:ANK_REP_REGION domain-containing protein n=1 Tax=Meloidogyne hapla TaxID=6305 RepID=A0A1I8AZ38_MELHA